MSERGCLSCQVASRTERPPGGLLFDGETWTLNHKLSDQARDLEWPGWFVLQPRRHVTSLSGLTPRERSELGALLAELDRRITEGLGAKRLYVASLGTKPDDHVHFHLFPVFEEPLPGVRAIGAPPLPDHSVEAVLSRLDFGDLQVAQSHAPVGIAKWGASLVSWLRKFSLYRGLLNLHGRVANGPGEKWIRGVAKQTPASLLVEFYVGVWLLVLGALLFASWHLEGCFWPLLIINLAAFYRAADILTFQANEVLFGSSNRVSTTRSVLLGLVNLGELCLCLAIGASWIQMRSEQAAFGTALDGGLDALLWSLGPLGAPAAAPVSDGAKAFTALALVIVLFFVLLVVGVLVSLLTPDRFASDRSADVRPERD